MLKKAVFLDRDGVINNNDKYYTYKVEDFIINDGVVEFLKLLQTNNYLIFIVSNQSGIAKNIYSINDVDKVHLHFINILKKENILITEILFCTHHPNISKCLCRKPSPLMLEKLIAKYSINPSKSYFIGDKESDCLTASRADVNPIKIEQNQNLMTLKFF